MKEIKKPLAIYVETSVWSMLIAENVPDKQIPTKKFFDEVDGGIHLIYISPLVLDELQKTSQPKRREQLLSLITRHEPYIIEEGEEVLNLAKLYIESAVLTEKHQDDATHIAYAVVNGIGTITSWNMEHIVKLKTRRGVNGINKIYGYPEIEIVTPQEVIESE